MNRNKLLKEFVDLVNKYDKKPQIEYFDKLLLLKNKVKDYLERSDNISYARLPSENDLRVLFSKNSLSFKKEFFEIVKRAGNFA